MFLRRLVAGRLRGRTALLAVGFFLSSVGASGLLVACDSSTPTEPMPSGTPNAAYGGRIFAENCNSCHPGGDRGAGVALKPLIPVLSDAQISTFVRHGKPPMPGYNESAISDNELASLILYLRTLK